MPRKGGDTWAFSHKGKCPCEVSLSALQIQYKSALNIHIVIR